jgi:RimJ/RimL family protein N-acetyltransferase
MNNPSGWYLRRAAEQDTDALHALLCNPQVYRYLLDGEPAGRSMIVQWIEEGRRRPDTTGFGVWLLYADTAQPTGCVRLAPYPQVDTAELIYALQPQVWGRGLATRMGWTIIDQALSRGHFERIIAGADQPNTASIAVMRRLGMTFLRNVQYPLGPGCEYIFHRGDATPDPLPQPLDVL